MEYIVNLNLSEYLLLFQILGVYLGVEFQTHPIMNIKRNIIFALESRKKNGVPIVENVPIRMRVIYASQRIEFTTGYRIDVPIGLGGDMNAMEIPGSGWTVFSGILLVLCSLWILFLRCQLCLFLLQFCDSAF